MRYILGISAYYHDSAAAIIRDGKVIAAAEEERFSRIKHDNNFPINAINFCLNYAEIKPSELSAIAYYEKPLLKFERILETFVKTYPFSISVFTRTIPEWLNEKIKVEHRICTELKYKGKIIFIPHHLSHASAAFLTSPFEKATVLTADGVGEHQTTGLWTGEGKKIRLMRSIDFPHSLGLLYSTFTAFLGFRVNDDEYKVMGMAAYGEAKFKEELSKLIDIKNDGSFSLNLSYFGFRESFKMWNSRFEKVFGKPRLKNEPITQRHRDMAASIQTVTEEIYFKILNHLYSVNKIPNLCVGGGLALNALANGKIFSRTPFKKVFIFGPAGDGGAAIGAALYASLKLGLKREEVSSLKLGSENKDNIEAILKNKNLKFKTFKNSSDLITTTAGVLADGKIVGWFQGRMEFGPRALGARSILAAPFPHSMKEKVNIIKRREQFRPFAGSILKKSASKYFELPSSQDDFPFMNFCFKVRAHKQKEIPAITHEDGTCRIQTVTKKDGIYYELIKEFESLTGVPIVLNTSFNVKGEPIVETIEQAINDFESTKLDYLAVDNFLIWKNY